MEPKNPTSATVTATMAAMRAAPNDVMNWTKSCTLPDPLVLPLGKNCLVHGYCLVKIAIARRPELNASGHAPAQVLLICYDSRNRRLAHRPARHNGGSRIARAAPS